MSSWIEVREASYSSPTRRKVNISVVAPGDASLPHSGDVEAAVGFQSVLEQLGNSSLYQFRGHSIFKSRGHFYLSIAKWLKDYSQYVVRQRNGLILVYNYPELTLISNLFKILTGRSFKVISYTAYVPSGTRGIDRDLFRRAIWKIANSLSDSIAYDPGLRASFSDTFDPRKLFELPDVVVDAKANSVEHGEARALRSAMGLSDKKVIGVVGPFHELNLLGLDWVWENISKFRQDAMFMVIGECPANHRRIHPRMIYVGWVDNIARYLSACDCFIIPRFRFTGAPMNKMVLGMSLGIPVITNAAEGLPITKDVEAIIGELGELPLLTNELLDNPEHARKVGERGRQFVALRYSQEALRSKFIELIQNVLGSL